MTEPDASDPTQHDLKPALLCACGGPLAEHQTGEGPWTGFCYGTHNPECDCELPTPETTR